MKETELKERLANIDKLQQETLKLHSEFELNRKKLNWFEISIGLAFFVAGVTVAKLFL